MPYTTREKHSYANGYNKGRAKAMRKMGNMTLIQAYKRGRGRGHSLGAHRYKRQEDYQD